MARSTSKSTKSTRKASAPKASSTKETVRKEAAKNGSKHTISRANKKGKADRQPWEMFREAFEKAVLMGLGATAMTADGLKHQWDQWANNLEQQGLVTPHESKKMVKDLQQFWKAHTAEHQRMLARNWDKESRLMETRLKGTAESALKKAVDALGLVTKDELHDVIKQARGPHADHLPPIPPEKAKRSVSKQQRKADPGSKMHNRSHRPKKAV